MSEEEINTFLKLSELPIKKLLISYFSIFLKENLLDICEEHNVPSSRIPKNYVLLADMIKLIQNNELPASLISNNSLLKLPTVQDTIKITDKNEKLYHLYVVLVDKNKKWDDAIFKPFGEDTAEIKKEVGGIMTIAMVAFNYLQTLHSELKTLSLVIDPENVTMRLVDNLIPTYDHTTRISFTID